MELVGISAQGISPRVVIWLMEQKDYLRSMVLIVAGIPQPAASIVGGVLEKGRHEVELVWMSSPRPRTGQQTIAIQQKNGKMKTMGGNEVTKASLKDLKEWNLTDSNNSLAKLQHKL